MDDYMKALESDVIASGHRLAIAVRELRNAKRAHVAAKLNLDNPLPKGLRDPMKVLEK